MTLLLRRLFVYKLRLPYDKVPLLLLRKMRSEVPASLEHYLAKVQIIIPDNLRRKGQVEEHGGGGALKEIRTEGVLAFHQASVAALADRSFQPHTNRNDKQLLNSSFPARGGGGC